MSNKECQCDIPNTDLSGRCFKCGGNLVFVNKTPPATPNTQLPAEIKAQIAAEALAKRYPGHDGVYIGKRNGIEIGYTAAGDKYARKGEDLQARCDRYEAKLTSIKTIANLYKNWDEDSIKQSAFTIRHLIKDVLNLANEALSGEGKEVENG